MSRHLKILFSLLVLALPAAALAGCGGLPGNAVAQVDGEAITKNDYDHWISVAAKSGGQPGAVAPDPPKFTKCAAALKKAQPKPAKGQPAVSDASLVSQCKQQYEALRTNVLGTLASFKWIEGEAAKQEVSVSDAEVKKRIDEIKKDPQFKAKGAFEKFLKQSGFTQADIELQTRTELLTNKIRDKVIKGKDKVSPAEIRTYYDKNKAKFAQPERRDLQVVLTKTKAKADAAKASIEGGKSFASVAKRDSIDETSKAQGGKLPGVAKGQQEKALDDAVFSAKEDALEGPVKTQFGYYVFKVTKVTKATQQSVQQAQATIKQLLVSEKQQKAVEGFAKDFQDRWKEKTECRKGYVVDSCKGAKPAATPAAGGAGAPGGAVPAQ